jgi:5'-3' exonuclease
MGAPYLKTLIFAYLFSKKDPFKSINLTNKNVIIDGYSFFYFIYYMVKEEDKNKSLTERITTNKFAYDGLSEKFREFLKRFKDHCENVCVVFDGSYEPNQYRRPDPQRDSSVRFNRSRSRLPPLMHDQLMSIVHDLNIKVRIAPGEADPMIVQMARNRDAYIVARDSDYFLYGATNGYVPLDTLDFSTLQGKYYHMEDVFQGMTQQGVALWATTIIYGFVKLDVLQVIIHFSSLNQMSKFFYANFSHNLK